LTIQCKSLAQQIESFELKRVALCNQAETENPLKRSGFAPGSDKSRACIP